MKKIYCALRGYKNGKFEKIISERGGGQKYGYPLPKTDTRPVWKVMQDAGGDVEGTVSGFHWPIHTVNHLHLHLIYPPPQVQGRAEDPDTDPGL